MWFRKTLRPMHRYRSFALVAVLFAALPAMGQGRPASRPTYSVSGTLRDDADHRTIENARVDLKLATGIPVNTTFTRGNGEFSFDGLPDGDYAIEIVAQGYEPFRDSFSISNSGRNAFSVFLRRALVVVTKNSSGLISAHELSVPRKAHEEYEKGLALLYSKSDFPGAIVQFQKAIKDYPKFYEAYAQVGSAYINSANMSAAEEALRKSVELSFNQYSDALFLLAGLLNTTHRYDEAESLSRKGLSVDSSSWQGQAELARALSSLKKTEEAEKIASAAQALNPDNPQIYLILANIHIQRRDYPGLQKDLESYVKLVPVGPEADQARKTLKEISEAMQRQDAGPGAASESAEPGDRSEDSSGGPASDDDKGSKQPDDSGSHNLPPLPPA